MSNKIKNKACFEVVSISKCKVDIDKKIVVEIVVLNQGLQKQMEKELVILNCVLHIFCSFCNSNNVKY